MPSSRCLQVGRRNHKSCRWGCGDASPRSHRSAPTGPTRPGAGSAPDPGNPRSPNPFGHVLELREDGDNPGATSFRWRIFLLCGDPANPDTYFAGYPKDKVSPIGSPDNMTFDNEGNIWLASDGTQPTGGQQRPVRLPHPRQRAGAHPAVRHRPGGRRDLRPAAHPRQPVAVHRRATPGRRRHGGGADQPLAGRWAGLPRPAVVTIWRSADGDPTIGR
jgi:uncharacterized protein